MGKGRNEKVSTDSILHRVVAWKLLFAFTASPGRRLDANYV
jgi:hypothetical protein